MNTQHMTQLQQAAAGRTELRLDTRLTREAAELLARADIHLNGRAAWDMQLRKPGVPERAFASGNLGLGEAYMDGDWDAQQLDEFFCHLLRARVADDVRPMRLAFHALYRAPVQPADGAPRLDGGQGALRPGQRLLCGHARSAHDLHLRLLEGCGQPGRGAGSQARPGLPQAAPGAGHARARHRLRLGQLHALCGGKIPGAMRGRDDLARAGRVCARHAGRRAPGLPLAGLPRHDEKFDRIVSIGMFEHVGHKNHRAFMEVAHRCLEDDGLFLLHTIGKNKRHSTCDPWIDKYIFPNGDLPSIGQIGDAMDDLFVAEDLHNFGADYDKTLMAWHANFELAWPRFAARLGERFHRMWSYYLLSCAGAFRARDLQLWQWVLSKQGVLGRVCSCQLISWTDGYQSSADLPRSGVLRQLHHGGRTHARDADGRQRPHPHPGAAAGAPAVRAQQGGRAPDVGRRALHAPCGHHGAGVGAGAPPGGLAAGARRRRQHRLRTELVAAAAGRLADTHEPRLSRDRPARGS